MTSVLNELSLTVPAGGIDAIPGVARLTGTVQVPAAPIYDVSSDQEFSDLLDCLPGRVRTLLRGRIREVEEIRMQAHGPVEVLYRHAHVVYPVVLGADDMVSLDSIGAWRADGRLGMEGTLHRFGRRTTNNVTSLVTVRVARALVGLAEPLRPWLETATDGLVIIGKPGDGKTTLLRDANRILAERLAGRLFINDSSNEILGDGYVPHPSMDWMSRITIGDPREQGEALNQCVKNFQPRWMEVDEISRVEDARSIAYARSRGVRAVMTWHAGSLAEAYREREERTLWPLIQRNEEGITGPPVVRLGVLIAGRGRYVVFEDLEQAFAQVANGELPTGVLVEVAQQSKWGLLKRD